MKISEFGSEQLDDLQDQISKNARLIERGRTIMRIVSDTGEKGLDSQALIKVANMCADGSVVTAVMFLQLMNARRVCSGSIRFLRSCDH